MMCVGQDCGRVWLAEYCGYAWTLLIALDVLLVAARATVTYVNAVEIHRAGRRTQLQSLSYHEPAVCAAAVNHCTANGQAGSAVKVKPVDHPSGRRSLSSIIDALSGRSLLPVLYLSSLVALFYLAVRVATSSAFIDVVTNVMYDVYTLRVRTHRSLSNAIVREQARLTTTTLMQSAQQFDLLALHAFDQYFRLGNFC